MICLFKDSADGLDPKLIFIRVDVGDHLVVGRSSSAAKKTEAVLRIPFARFNSRFSRRRRLSSSSIVSPPEASESSRTEALSRYQARNVW